MLTRLYNPHIGGVERHLMGITGTLIEKGNKVTIITEQYDPYIPLEEKTKSLKIYRIPHNLLKSKIKIWKWLFDKESMIRHYDIVHVHDVFWWYLPLRCIGKKPPVYITFHGYEPGRTPPLRRKLARKIYEKLSEDSLLIGAYLNKWYLTKSRNISYGAASIMKFRLPKNNNTIFMGRLSDDTGIKTYLKAIKHFNKKLYLDIYGKGPLEKKIIAMINKNRIPAAVHGTINDISGALKSSRYVFASQYLSILEAMQARRLVLAVYDNEIKKDYLYCHPQAHNMIIAGSGMELAEKFNNLKPETEIKMIDEAYRWAKDQTWEKLTELYLNLWQKTR